MKIENVEVYGFRRALHGMRNPQDSWADSDSVYWKRDYPELFSSSSGDIFAPERPHLGPKDLDLARKLIMRGSEHCKFLREIVVWMDITIPRYVWQELDTYKVATVRNSCSTMNKLGSRDLEQSDFELDVPELTLERINQLGRLLREAKEEHAGVRQARRELKNELCEGFLQKATYFMSYQTALAAILQRENHRLPEWRMERTEETPEVGSITQNLIALPYMREFHAAATFKRNQLREAIAEITSLVAGPTDESGKFLAITVEQLMEIRNKLKRAA
jgi:hypothetical protein